MANNYQDCWTYPKEKIDELVTDWSYPKDVSYTKEEVDDQVEGWSYSKDVSYTKEEVDALIAKSITVKTGTATGRTGATLSDRRVVQKGRVVECHFVCTLDAAVGASEKKIADISGVDLPPLKIRFTCSSGAAAYNAKNACYAIISTDGEIAVLASTTTDTIIIIDLVYTVD